jgi:hypothetical protein
VGGGGTRKNIKRKNVVPSPFSKYVATASLLLPLAILLPLTKEPKKRLMIEGRSRVRIYYEYSSALVTDGLDSDCVYCTIFYLGPKGSSPFFKSDPDHSRK